jgi:hypothetical protein
MTLVDYLKSRLFDPLQIETPWWQESPEGYNVGYTGMWLKTEDMIKLAELYLNEGVWHGRRLLSGEWTKEATSSLISTSQTNKGNAAFGYGYQFWQARDNAFRGLGLGGQHAIAIPKYNACIAFSAFDQSKSDRAIDIIWELILPALA